MKYPDAPWKEDTRHERNLKIWREELDAFVPEKVLDFHVHVFAEGVIPEGQNWGPIGHPLNTYDYDDLAADLPLIYPGRETAAVCFGTPTVAYDRARSNAYNARAAVPGRFFPLRLFDPLEDTPDETRRELETRGFYGIKPYLTYVRKPDPNQVEIVEMVPDWIMEQVNDLGQIVLLHIPRKARLADPLNQQHIADLCRRYPRAKIVLAHVGRAYYLKSVVGHLDRLRELPNLWYDVAMVTHWEVLAHFFKTVRPDRVLYATDLPLAVAPGKSVEINHQYAYVTPIPTKLSISDDHGKIVFTSFLYEELRACKKAMESLGLGRDYARGFFWDNGMALLNTVRQARRSL